MRWRVCLWVGFLAIATAVPAALGATVIVNPGEDIQAAINAASEGDVIQLAAGTHDVAATVDVNKAITIEGLGLATVRGTTAEARNVFKITASGVALQNMGVTVTTTYALGGELEDCLIGVPDNAALSDVVISGNTLYWPAQGGPMSDWGGRAITVGKNGAPGVLITGNTVYNTRNGIVVRYNNPATISDNLVYNTKGGVMNYTSNQADADTRTITGNTWGTVHNEWDIVWNSGGEAFAPDYRNSVLAVSGANDEAYVLDRRNASNDNYAVGNRSHVFLSPGGAEAAHEAKGNMNEPFASFALGIDAVVAEGTVYVDIGVYQEQAVIDKSLSVIGNGTSTVLAAPAFPGGTSWTQTWTLKIDGNQPGLTGDVSLRNLSIEGLNHPDSNWFVIVTDHIPAGVALTLQDLRIAGSYLYGWWDYHSHGNLLFERNTVENVEYGMMLEGWDTGSVTIRDSQFSQVPGYFGYPAGIFLFTYNGLDCNNAYLIEGNVIENAGPGYGIAVYGGYPGQEPAKYTNVVIQGNEISGIGYYGVYLRNLPESGEVTDGGVHGARIARNDLSNNMVGLLVVGENPGARAHYNDLSGNSQYGVRNTGAAVVDAMLNWWGDVDGPSGEGTGGGSAVTPNVIYSPWLGLDPDGDPLSAGVQITGPLYIIVAPVGPAPADGYLNAAIGGSNEITGVGAHTIEVRHGTYDASEPITNPVNIVSEPGSASHTTLTGPMSLGSGGILIGGPLQGFTILGDVTIEELVNAASSKINWSNLYGTVSNKGTGTFDAKYNFWGTQEYAVIDARTIGDIAVDPYLPKNADDSYDDIVVLINAGVVGSIDGAIQQLWSMDRLGQDVNTFINYQNVAGAGAFQALPAGAQIGLGDVAGGGGGLETTIGGSYEVGEVIDGRFVLTDPITGAPIGDALVTVSLLGPDGTGLAFWGVTTYDESTGEYLFEIDTSGLAPGTYELILQTADGQTETLTIEIEEP